MLFLFTLTFIQALCLIAGSAIVVGLVLGVLYVVSEQDVNGGFEVWIGSSLGSFVVLSVVYLAIKAILFGLGVT